MTRPKTPPSVALIGCGPSGMFFLHALAVRRAALARSGDAAALAALPLVTCFERAAGPGGVWRADRFQGDPAAGDGAAAASTSMYEALWTNGPKEAMEFFDHTYREHFGCALPTYLPRAMVLEYLLERCTKRDPDLFRDVRFDTSVASVTHDAAADRFTVRLDDGGEGLFDACVWATGNNGTPSIPTALAAVFAEGGFRGATMHSSQTDADFDRHVSGKRVLIVGDAYSAEDLALTAIKLGVDSIDIVARTGTGVASTTGSWPMDKVEIHTKYAPTGVTGDGRGIVLSKTNYDDDTGKYVIEAEGQVTLGCIDTIIYCTGYAPNTQMLHESLMPCTDAEGYCVFKKNEFPDSWKMSVNPLSGEIGDVPLDDVYMGAPFDTVHPDLYRGRLISVPSMFFLTDSTDSPLLELDIMAWRTLAQVAGDLPLPSPADMRRHNTEVLLHFMDDPGTRFDCDDGNYRELYLRQMEILGARWDEDQIQKQYYALSRQHYEASYRYLAREAQDAGYPVDFGTLDALNEKGHSLVACQLASEVGRYKLDEASPDAAWRTFRDNDTSNVSIFTGTAAVPLKRRWLDLDRCETVADIVADAAAVPRHGGARAPTRGDRDPAPPGKPTRAVEGDDSTVSSHSSDGIPTEESVTRARVAEGDDSTVSSRSSEGVLTEEILIHDSGHTAAKSDKDRISPGKPATLAGRSCSGEARDDVVVGEILVETERK